MLKLKDALKGNKRLVENIFSLSVLQGANYLLPLITVPYLVRVLGPERYGLLGFAQAFAQYFVILTDYGFNMSATRQIAMNQHDPQAISEIFSSVTLIKLALMLVSFLLMVGIVSFLPEFQQYGPVYYVSFLLVLGKELYRLSLGHMYYYLAGKCQQVGAHRESLFWLIKACKEDPVLLSQPDPPKMFLRQSIYLLIQPIASLFFTHQSWIQLRKKFRRSKIDLESIKQVASQNYQSSNDSYKLRIKAIQ